MSMPPRPLQTPTLVRKIGRMTVYTPWSDERRPNVIWFIVDQLRAQAMSVAGDPNLSTPNLDRLAREGVWFRRAVSGAPLCCPARGSFLTGILPHRCVAGHEYALPDSLPTMGSIMGRSGYHTSWFGKWHLDGHSEHGLEQRAAWHLIPRERRGGFRTWIGYENNNAPWDCWVHGHNGEVEVPLHRLPGHETDALTDLLLQEIELRHRDQFFSCISIQPPHDPHVAPAEWLGRHPPHDITLRANVPPVEAIAQAARHSLAGYYAQIEHLDRQIGRLIALLSELRIDDHTYVVFVSDHGDQHGSHGHFAKLTPYEESIRVPLMIWGGHRWSYYNRSIVDVPFNHVDLAPTTLGLCGIDTDQAMDGFDYAHLVRSGARAGKAPAEAYLQSVVPTGHGDSVDLPWRGVVTSDQWKYVCLPGQPWLMFDLAHDPFELVNLAHHAHAAGRRHHLNQRLRDWVERTGDHFQLPEFDGYGHPVENRDLTTHWPRMAGR